VSGEAVLSAENGGNLWAVGLCPNPAGELMHSATPDLLVLAGGDGTCFPLPRTSPPLLAVGLDFQVLPHSAASPNSLHFPLMLRGLDKNTGSAYFRRQRMHQNAGCCIIIIFFLISGSTRVVRGDIHFLTPTHPVPTRQMLGPLHFFYAGYGPGTWACLTPYKHTHPHMGYTVPNLIENRVLRVSPSRSLKVIGTDTDRSATYYLLLTFHINHVRYRFQDISRYWSNSDFLIYVYLTPFPC